MSLERRLERLEQDLHVFQREPTEEDMRWAAAWRQVVATMVPEHHRVLETHMKDEATGAKGRALSHAVADLCDKGYAGPLAMPQEVAGVYLSDPSAMPLHDCEDCGFRLPIRPGQAVATPTGLKNEPAVSYFKRCPLCGGRTGYYAYWTKHGKRGHAYLRLRLRPARRGPANQAVFLRCLPQEVQ